MSLMEQFANPETMHSLSMGEKLAGAGITTLMGMGITFIVLILLWGCIAVMNKIMKAVNNKGTKASAPAPAEVATSAPAAAAAPVATAEPKEDDQEIAAVISAAIAAYQGDGATSNLVVRKIKRVTGPSTTWAREGRRECIESRNI